MDDEVDKAINADSDGYESIDIEYDEYQVLVYCQ